MSDEKTIFEKVVTGELPGTIHYQDNYVSVFDTIEPQAKIHLLIVPNKAIASVAATKDSDEAILGRMFTAARKVAEKLGIAQSGYRLIINTGPDSNWEIKNHLHMHLLGGEKLKAAIND